MVRNAALDQGVLMIASSLIPPIPIPPPPPHITFIFNEKLDIKHESILLLMNLHILFHRLTSSYLRINAVLEFFASGCEKLQNRSSLPTF